MLETNAETWVGKVGLTIEEMAAYRLPDFSDDFQPHSIFLGSFFKWDSFENTKISEQYGSKLRFQQQDGCLVFCRY